MGTKAAEKNSDLLLRKGGFFNKLGLRVMLIAIIVFVLDIISVAISSSSWGDGTFAENIIDNLPISALLFSIAVLGLFSYLFGLLFLGIGQIAKNTDK